MAVRRQRRAGRYGAEWTSLIRGGSVPAIGFQLDSLKDRLTEYNIRVELTEAARKWLAKEGYDPAFGARPLRRAIQKHVESPLSVDLLAGKYKDGATVLVDVDEKKNQIVFHAAEALKRTKQPAAA
jgi:ATP-dependent Clp protease ATP-binding subunit ClpA